MSHNISKTSTLSIDIKDEIGTNRINNIKTRQSRRIWPRVFSSLRINENRKSTLNLLELASNRKDSSGCEFSQFNELKELRLTVPKSEQSILVKTHVEKLRLSSEGCYVAVIVDGLFSPDLSHLDCLPSGLHVDNLESLQTLKSFSNELSKLNNISSTHGGFFSNLNSATSKNALCIFAEPGSTLNGVSLQILVISSGSDVSSP